MSMLPVPSDDPSGWLTTRQAVKARRAQENAELAIHNHRLAAQARAEMDIADSQAAADAVRASLDEELTLLQDGLAKAGQSAAALEIVAGKVQLLNAIDNRGISRRFGG
jgi:hypothetical protein